MKDCRNDIIAALGQGRHPKKLAEQYGVSETYVYDLRRRHVAGRLSEIRRETIRRMTEAGSDNDVIAEFLSMDPNSVRRIRKQIGLQTRPARAAQMAALDWSMTDNQLAKLTGENQSVIAYWRGRITGE